MFIELTQLNGCKVLINIDNIRSIHTTSKGNTEILLVSAGCWEVRESYDEVKSKLFALMKKDSQRQDDFINRVYEETARGRYNP